MGAGMNQVKTLPAAPLPAAMTAGLDDMLRLLLTAVLIAAAGVLLYGLISFLRRRGKKNGRGNRSGDPNKATESSNDWDDKQWPKR